MQNTESKAKNIGIKILLELSRIILGVTFIFSGFVKAVDPWGGAYKIEDYLGAFGLARLASFSFIFSSALCVFEFILGAFILFGLYRKWTARLLFLTMLFMTPLTLYLAIANPVADCGCFGDALVITNWQTFYKNIVLIIASIIVLIYHERITNLFTGKTYWLAFFFIIVFAFGFVIRNYIYEPMFDFRPYSVGTKIEDKMFVPIEKQRVEEPILVYAKDGKEQSFTMDNYPWSDSTWTFVRTDMKVIQEGIEPAIKDFIIKEITFNYTDSKILEVKDITNKILSDTGYTFLMISPMLEKLNMNYLPNLEDVDYYAKANNYGCYFLTASTSDEIIKFVNDQALNFNICIMDERVLKTITRTNPGLLLIKDGVIIHKWADLEIPTESQLQGPIENLSFSKLVDKSTTDKNNLIYISLIFFIPLLLLKIFDYFAFHRNKVEEQESKITN